MATVAQGPPVHILATGTANLASVAASFERLGTTPIVTEDPRQVSKAMHLVLPGVGAFGPAMQHLEARGLTGALRERVLEGRPLLAICLGLQLLFEASDESPGVRGIGVLPGVIRRLPGEGGRVRIPHMGWNAVEVDAGCRLTQSGVAYFANSCALLDPSAGLDCARTMHGETTFVGALERGSLLACQFHPELSGRWGSLLLLRWLTTTGASASMRPPVARAEESRRC